MDILIHLLLWNKLNVQKKKKKKEKERKEKKRKEKKNLCICYLTFVLDQSEHKVSSVVPSHH